MLYVLEWSISRRPIFVWVLLINSNLKWDWTALIGGASIRTVTCNGNFFQ